MRARSRSSSPSPTRTRTSHLNDGVGRVRRLEHREPLARGHTRLTGTKYRWLRNPAHFDPAVWRAFGPLHRSTLAVARAWALTESAASLWEYHHPPRRGRSHE